MALNFPDPPARLHLIGLKGVAMTALAEILQGQGYRITGSDTAEVFPSDPVLKRLGIPCVEGFDALNVGRDVAAVVYSTAYPSDHVERRAARERGVPEWSYPELVGLLCSLHSQGVAVAGSHGKTTTTALLARMLEEGGLDPTAIVGSTVAEWGSNARLGLSPWFVLEADEYQNKFRYYRPRHLLLTNVDYDHPDFFPDVASYQQAFLDFAAALPPEGTFVLWGEEPLQPRLRDVTRARLITYGISSGDDWQLRDVVVAAEEGTAFSVVRRGERYGDFRLALSGEHYALDAVGAMAMADVAGVGAEAVGRAIRHFRGTARRLEYRGQYRGAVVIDDYAHHPTEVAVTLRALRQRYGARRLWCVFQAHTFSRTAAFLAEFAAALARADHVLVPPIYASAREAGGAVTNETLAEAVNRLAAGRAEASASLEAAVERLRGAVGERDVVVTMGAGDVWRVAEALASERRPSHKN